MNIFSAYYNAKLLITSEYLVLNGAEALAMPLRFGQSLEVSSGANALIWTSVAQDGTVWFKGEYSLTDFQITSSSDAATAIYPQRLLRAARKLKPDFCVGVTGLDVVSKLNYPQPWGLGSSSTLIAAVAGWANIDPFQLHFSVSNGSGYDIACALSNTPIIYKVLNQQPEYRAVSFRPDFASRIFFAYLGRKQDSAEGIKSYKARNVVPSPGLIQQANALTGLIMNASGAEEFEKLLTQHEEMISSLLGVSPLGKTIFAGMPGAVKSLGAWGGDFCMGIWQDDISGLPAFMKSKGIETWFNFNEIVL